MTVLPKATGVTILVDGEDLAAAAIDLAAEKTLELTAEAAPSDAQQDVTWTTSDAKIATVNAAGLVTGLKVGAVTITATAKDGTKKADSIKITLSYVAKGLAIPETLTLIAGGKLTLTPVFDPANTTKKTLVWASADPTVATVTSAGLVTAAAVTEAKTTTITATTTDGSELTAECAVTVLPKATGVTILVDGLPAEEASTYVNDENKPLVLSAQVSPADAQQDVTWTTSDAKIATVDAAGLVTGIKAGNVTITARAKDGTNKSDTIAVRIKAGTAQTVPVVAGDQFVDTIYLGKSPMGTMAKAWYDPDSVADGETVAWSVSRISGPENVAKVSLLKSKNEVTLYYSDILAEGAATFRVTCAINGDAERSAYYDFSMEVREALPEDLPEGIRSLEAQPMRLDVGETYYFGYGDIVDQNDDALPDYMKAFYDWPNALDDSAVEDESGVTLTFDQPGRYTVTAVALAGSITYFAPITVLVGGEDPEGTINLIPEILSKTVYSEGDGNRWIGAVYTENLTLMDGEEPVWNLERVSGSEAVTLSYWTDSADRINVQLIRVGEVETEETAVFRASCYVSDKYKGEATFEITVKPKKPEDLPAAISYPIKAVSIPKNGSVTVLFNDIQGMDEEGKTVPLPEGTWFSAFCEENDFPTYYGDDRRILTFTREGRYILKVDASCGNTSLQTPIVVTVGSGVSADARIEAGMRTGVIYADAGIDSAYVGSAEVKGVGLLEGEKGKWELIPDDEDPAVTLFIDWIEGNHASFSYRDIKGLGEVGYTLKYSAVPTAQHPNGLFQATEHITVRVVNKPENAPDGISFTPEKLSLTTGDTYTFDTANIAFTGGTLDADEKKWYELWYGDKLLQNSDIDQDSEPGKTTITFNAPGRYVLTAAAGFGNCEYTKQVPIIVRDEGAGSFKLSLFQRMKVLYLDGQDESRNLGGADAINFEGLEGEETSWDIQRIDANGGNPVEMFIGYQDSTFASIDYTLGDEPGEATFEITMTAGEGEQAYIASETFTVTVEASVPEDFPTGIDAPFKKVYDIGVGVPLTFDASLIEFAEGEIPEGVKVWREIWTDDGDWGQVEAEDHGSDFTFTFNAAGRYFLKAAIGIDNNMYTQLIEVRVTDEEGGIFSWIDRFQRFTTLYEDGEREANLGYLYVGGVTLKEGDDWEWSVEKTSPGDAPVELIISNDDPNGTGITCALTEGTGKAKFELHYSAVDGLYEGTWEFSVEVLPGLPEGLPTGIVIPYGPREELQVGDTLVLDKKEIRFSNGAQAPVGAEVWRNFWHSLWNWDEVELYESGSIEQYTFRAPGRYVMEAVIGISGNYVLKSEIEIIVTDEDEPLFTAKKNQQFKVAYTTGEEEAWLGSVWLDNVDLRDDRDDWEWKVEKTSGDAPFEVVLWDNYTDHATVGFVLNGEGTGEATYTLSFSAANGLYEDSWDFTVQLKDTLPADFPQGITVDFGTKYERTVGGSVTLDTAQISFASGEDPEGQEVWRDLWTDGGDWEQVNEEWDETARTYTFNAAGRYFVKAVIGVANIHYEQLIDIRVTDETGSMISSVDLLQRYTMLFETGEEWTNLGYLYVGGLTLKEDEDWSWKVKQETPGDAPFELVFEEAAPNGGNLSCQLTGGTGEATYTLSLSAAGGLYQRTWYFTIEVVPGLPVIEDSVDMPYQPEYNIHVGDMLSFDREAINFGGEVPGGTEIWSEIWQDVGNWDNVYLEEEDSVYSFTFNDVGRYVLTAAVGVGNYISRASIVINVRDGKENLFYAQQHQRYDVMYLDGSEGENLGSVWLNGVALKEDEHYHWDVVQTGGDAGLVNVFDANSDENHIDLHCERMSGTGSATYTVSYTAAGGLYADSWYFTIRVEAAKPLIFPTGITTPYQDSYNLSVGEQKTFSKADLGFEGGASLGGYKVWRELWGDSGNWYNVTEEWDDEACTYTFNEPGRYFLRAVVGVESVVFDQQIEFIVRDGEKPLFTSKKNQRFYVAYAQEESDTWLGNVLLGNVSLRKEDDWNWKVKKSGEGDAPFEVVLWDNSAEHANLGFVLGEGTGEATYTLSYSAADGLYEDSWDFTVRVDDTLPEGFPEGIVVDFDTEYERQVGGSVTLDMAQIHFERGEAPNGFEAWRELWTDRGDWGQVVQESEGTARTYTFNAAGRYFIKAAIGVGNVHYEKLIDIVVKDGEQPLFAADDYQRYSHMYLDGTAGENLGWIRLNGIALKDGEKYDWDVVQTDGDPDLINVFGTNSDENHIDLHCERTENTGSATYTVSYTAADGLYADSWDFTIQVEAAKPLIFPTGITTPYEASYEKPVGGELTFDKAQMGFEGVDNPDDLLEYEVWRELWRHEGDWSQVEESWDGEACTYTFRKAGTYVLRLIAGVESVAYDQLVTIVVTEA